MKNKIYLDYNATAPLRPESAKAMVEIMKKPLNASAVHSFGRQGRMLVEKARIQIATTINAPTPGQVIFNSGATESNNTILKHFTGERILVSTIEHISVLSAAPNAKHIPVTKDGIVDLNALETLLKQKPTALISVMMVNSETGVIQPVKEISTLTKNHGALLHCDTTQAIGRIPVDMQDLGIDFLTFSSHKIGGPQGVGALALGLCGITPTLLHGGGQEKSARAGTENVAGITGFGIAAELATIPQSHQEKLETFLKSKGAIIYGENAPRVPNTTFFSIPNLKAETALMAMDLEDIAISNGSACSSGTVKPSHVLKAMGTSDDQALSGLRISTGYATTQIEIDTFIEKFDKFLERIQK
ncbi:cysteine desulfurase [Alphaproteobacteria bacterium]|nr:cysteine desulfurase [Alphaproteobacteria bacterium]